MVDGPKIASMLLLLPLLSLLLLLLLAVVFIPSLVAETPLTTFVKEP